MSAGAAMRMGLTAVTPAMSVWSVTSGRGLAARKRLRQPVGVVAIQPAIRAFSAARRLCAKASGRSLRAMIHARGEATVASPGA